VTDELVVAERPLAVVVETTTWEAFPALWPALLGEVWQAVRGNDELAPGRNVMLYRDDTPTVEVGVEVEVASFAPIGRVVPSALPAGRVVTATHRGGFDPSDAHRAVVEACLVRGLRRLGPRWEVYGHETGDPAAQEVEVFHLVRGVE
jgi:effector-binding domain-containing protein